MPTPTHPARHDLTEVVTRRESRTKPQPPLVVWLRPSTLRAEEEEREVAKAKGLIKLVLPLDAGTASSRHLPCHNYLCP